MRTTWWDSGKWNAICDVCGFKFKDTDLKRRWDGLMVCSDDYEMQHPQERIRPIPDQKKLPWTRPEATDVFQGTSAVNGNLVTGATPTYANTVDTDLLPILPIVSLPNNPSTTTLLSSYVDVPVGPAQIAVAIPSNTTTQSITIDSTLYPTGTGFIIIQAGTFSPRTVILDAVSYTVNVGLNFLGASAISVKVII
jgi:hypothetical protein